MWDAFHVCLEPQPLHKGSIQPTVVITDQTLTNKCGGNDIMMDPYHHPQHMKVVIRLWYVWSGCGKHSMWVWSLNHCTRASLGAKQWSTRICPPIFKILTNKCGGNSMMRDPYPHPHYIKVVNCHWYVWSGCGKHSMWVWSLNYCTRASFGCKQCLSRISACFPNLDQWHDAGSIPLFFTPGCCQTALICLTEVWWNHFMWV